MQPELLYSGKWGGEMEVGQNRLTWGSRLRYLDLPVVARANYRGLVLEAGPQASTLIGNKDERVLSYYTLKRYAALQLGYVVGLGVELPSGVSVGLRYSDDLTPLNAGVRLPGYRDHYRNSVWQAQVGYLLASR